jgi:DNA-binding LacI/PurR family transcriptional regulator
MARATLKDVAKKAGVSTATVSYVLNGKKKINLG